METTLLQWKVPDAAHPSGEAVPTKSRLQLAFSWQGVMVVAIVAGLWCGSYWSAFTNSGILWILLSNATPESVRVTDAGLKLSSWIIVTKRVPWAEIELYKFWKPGYPHQWHLEVKARRGKRITKLFIPIDDRHLDIESLRQAFHQYVPLNKEIVM